MLDPRRALAATAVAAWLTVGVAAVSAHSQLVTSSPGAGAVVAATPVEIRLVFSEPVEARFTAADLVDRYGTVLVAATGSPDPADPRTLVVRPPSTLDDGIYRVEWRAVSAADGHATSGFFTFGVGTGVSPGTATSGGATGELHGGHEAGTVTLEIIARLVGYLGLLVAFGLAVVAVLVLRPAALPPRILPRDRAGPGRAGRWERLARRTADFFLPGSTDVQALDRSLARVAGAGLIGSSIAAVLLVIATTEGPAGPVRYLSETRTGLLLAVRIALGLAGGTLALALAARRPRAALAAGATAGSGGIVALALGGHAAAGSAAAIATMVVHLAAAATWLSGVLVLAGVAARWRDADGRAFLRAAVPRFTALALVAVALVGLTGLILEWTTIRALIPFGTAYGMALAIKVAVFGLALAVGAANFFDGGRGTPSHHALRRRLAGEALMAIAVLVAAANLASGSPPGGQEPVVIERAPMTVPAALAIELQVLPARPGPNRLDVVLPGDLDATSTVDLVLARLDAGGSVRYETRRVAGAALDQLSPGAHFVVDGGLLAAGSRWDATAVVHGPDGTETARQRFTFSLDASTITDGAATLPVDPARAVAALLAVLALLGLAFAVAGGRLPRAEPTAGRRALLAGAAAGIALSTLVLAIGVG